MPDWQVKEITYVTTSKNINTLDSLNTNDSAPHNDVVVQLFLFLRCAVTLGVLIFILIFILVLV